MEIGFFGDSLVAGRFGVSFVDILADRLPDDHLFNFGRNGDSVLDTHEFLTTINFTSPLDLAVVWTGVNDVLPTVSPSFRVLRRIIGKPWTHASEEFVAVYSSLLDWMSGIASHSIVLPPLCISEDLNSPWNAVIARMAHRIRELVVQRDDVTFLDVHEPLRAGWQEADVSDSFSDHFGAVARDTILIRSGQDADRLTEKRGLLFTFDGIHLNSRGAALVANLLQPQIEAVMSGASRSPDGAPGM